MGLMDYNSGGGVGGATSGASAAREGGFSWKALLPALLGGVGGAAFGGKEGLAGFASGFANESYRRKREEDQKNFAAESALADQAHKDWQDLSSLDLSNIPPEMAGVRERLDALNQKYIQSLSADSPGGARRTAKESQELIALAATLRGSVPKIQQGNEDATFMRHEGLKQQAADAPFITGRENQMLSDAGVDRSELGSMSLPPEELHRLAGDAFTADRAAAQQRQFTGVQSLEAIQQEIDKAKAIHAIQPPPVALGAPASKYLGLGEAGSYSAADIDVMKQKREAEARVQAAATGRANLKPIKVIRQNPKTGRKQIVLVHPVTGEVVADLGAGPISATSENRADAAEAVLRTAADITTSLQDPRVRANLGPVLGRYNNLHEFIGNPPPEFANLAGEIESFSLANMGVHGMRSVQGANQIKDMLSGKHTPESLAAAVQGLSHFSQNFIDTTRGKPPVAGTQPASSKRKYTILKVE